MLRQQYLIAKHGLASAEYGASAPSAPIQTLETPPQSEAPEAPEAPEATAATADQELREEILDVTLLRKQYAKQDYQDYVFFDIAFSPNGLDKPARAIKGESPRLS